MLQTTAEREAIVCAQSLEGVGRDKAEFLVDRRRVNRAVVTERFPEPSKIDEGHKEGRRKIP